MIEGSAMNSANAAPSTAGSAAAAPSFTDGRWGTAGAGDFIQLLKPRVMSLSIFTALTGLVLAPVSIHPIVALAAILAIALGAGAAGALNMWYEAELDARMHRTSRRPLPEGRVSPDEALSFGAVLAVLSVLAMSVLVNYLAAALLAFTILFYVVIYTMWLKPRTAQNIVIGGAAGALPPVIGWVAATGTLSWQPWVLFAVIFLWTPPHFWALALTRAADYERVGLPMMPNVAGPASTRRQMMVYTVILAAVSLLPGILHFAGPIYMATAAVMDLVFLAMVFHLMRLGTIADGYERVGDPKAPRFSAAAHKQAFLTFKFSLLYLFALFAALLAGAVL